MSLLASSKAYVKNCMLPFMERVHSTSPALQVRGIRGLPMTAPRKFRMSTSCPITSWMGMDLMPLTVHRGTLNPC